MAKIPCILQEQPQFYFFQFWPAIWLVSCLFVLLSYVFRIVRTTCFKITTHLAHLGGPWGHHCRHIFFFVLGLVCDDRDLAIIYQCLSIYLFHFLSFHKLVCFLSLLCIYFWKLPQVLFSKEKCCINT